MSVLLIGAGGQLGRTLLAENPSDSELVTFDSKQLDITSTSKIKLVMETYEPRCIINACAYTKVDAAEDNESKAYEVNQVGVQNLATLSPVDCRIIHISTDFVFDGNKDGPYLTSDRENPVNIYGKSKLAGERALTKFHKRNSIIIRTSWLYSEYGNNFVTTMLRLMREKEELVVVDDQIGVPTSAHSLANLIWKAIDHPVENGIFHWRDAGQATWFEFACRIQEIAMSAGLLERKISIVPVGSRDYPSTAVRPGYSVLDIGDTEECFHIQAKPWQEELVKVINKVKVIEDTA